MAYQKILAALAALSFIQVHGIALETSSTDSIKSAASKIASGMVSYYNGNETGNTPGLLPMPYYWYEGGAMFDTLIQYFHLTGDSQYNSIVTQGLVFQQGPNGNFMPTNQTKSEGNDDQDIWALAAMSAAELKLPEPVNTSWVALADAVFNDQVARWDTATCNGGLRWQIFAFNNGYNYKNSISNGLFFELSSRLARYTGNTTYSDWATKVYDWTTGVGFIDSKFNAYDGSSTDANCTAINRIQFTYVAGTLIAGAAYQYNTTAGSSVWKSRLDGLLNQTLATFFPNGIATEIACESHNTCTVDMKMFKGLLAQQLIRAVQVAPYTASLILPKITSTATAAAAACNGGSGTACKLNWSEAGNSSDTGLGQQLSALSYVQALLVTQAATVVTGSTGGSNGTATSGGANATSTAASAPAVTKNAGITLGGGAGSTLMMTILAGIAFFL